MKHPKSPRVPVFSLYHMYNYVHADTPHHRATHNNTVKLQPTHTHISCPRKRSPKSLSPSFKNAAHDMYFKQGDATCSRTSETCVVYTSVQHGHSAHIVLAISFLRRIDLHYSIYNMYGSCVSQHSNAKIYTVHMLPPPTFSSRNNLSITQTRFHQNTPHVTKPFPPHKLHIFLKEKKGSTRHVAVAYH